MNSEWILIDREALLTELQQAFDAQTAEVLLRVLDKVAAQARQGGMTREDFAELRQSLQALAEAQQRTEQAVRELAEAQRRTEERVGNLEAAMERLAEAQQETDRAVKELAEAQQRTEERVGSLELVVAEARQQTARAVAELTKAFDRLRKQVGGLSETVGGDIENIAYIVLYEVLKREFGWHVGVLERSWQTWDKKPEEINVFGTATDPLKPGQTIWIIGEAKHNLTVKEVKRFAKQVERARQHLQGEIFPVCFCYRARPEVQQKVKEAGLRLVFSYGKLV
jgi:uncharacterized phage infection (PIP) family protein YhgE